MKVAAVLLASFAFVQPAHDRTLAAARLSLTGLGAVRIGMLEDHVRDATPAGLSGAPGAGDACVQRQVLNDPGIVLMFEKRILTRIDVADAHHATVSGLTVGDADARAREIYAGRFEEQRHKYDGNGRYLVVRSSDRRYALVIETDGSRVTRLHAGVVPSAEYVEGCS